VAVRPIAWSIQEVGSTANASFALCNDRTRCQTLMALQCHCDVSVVSENVVTTYIEALHFDTPTGGWSTRVVQAGRVVPQNAVRHSMTRASSARRCR